MEIDALTPPVRRTTGTKKKLEADKKTRTETESKGRKGRPFVPLSTWGIERWKKSSKLDQKKEEEEMNREGKKEGFLHDGG